MTATMAARLAKDSLYQDEVVDLAVTWMGVDIGIYICGCGAMGAMG